MAKQDIVITTRVEGLQAITRLNEEIVVLKKVSDKAAKEVDKLKKKLDRDLAAAAVRSTRKLDRLKAKIGRDLFRAAARTTTQLDRLKAKIGRDLARAAVRATKKLDRLEEKLDDLRTSLKKTQRTTSVTSGRLDDVAGMFSKMGGAGGAAAGKLESLSVMMTGPLGAAIAGSMIAVGGLMVAFKAAQVAVDLTLTSVKAYIDETPVLKEASDRAVKALDGVKIAFGEAATGGEDFKRVLVVVEKEFNKFAKDIKKESTDINEAFKVIMTMMTFATHRIIGWFALVAEWFVLIPDLIMTIWGVVRKALLGGLQGLLEVMGPIAVMLRQITQDELDSAKKNLKGIVSEQKMFFMDYSRMVMGATRRVDEFVDKVNEAFQAVKKGPKADRLPGFGPEGGRTPGWAGRGVGDHSVRDMDPEGLIPTPKGKGGTGGKGAVGAAATAYISPFQRRGPAGGSVTDLHEYGQAAQSLRESMQGLQEDLASPVLEEVNTQLSETVKWLREGEAAGIATAAIWGGVLVESLTMVKDGLIDMTSHIAQTMGAFHAGVGTMAEFGDSVLDMFGNLASQIGTMFIATGIGMAFLSPLQGAGMIAAGIALNAIGGWMGAKGSGNAGRGGGGGGSAGTESTITREIQRSLRGPDQGGTSTTIEVIIAGRAIEPEMVSIIDDISRLRRSRQFGRMRA